MRVSAEAVACANIALVKYWGKRDANLNLPAAGSLSLTLDALQTTTKVTFDSIRKEDELLLDGKPADPKRISAFVDIARDLCGQTSRVRVESSNNFPTASGLASSASAFAALAVAVDEALELNLSPSRLSELARRGSGSAARSIFPGMVVMQRGERTDGHDSYAYPLPNYDQSLRMVVAIVGGGAKKEVSSRNAMDHCAATSPLYQAWLDTVPGDLKTAIDAIENRNLAALGAVTEASAMAMHAAALASRPAVRYLQPATLLCLDAVQALRHRGVNAFATMDAGPHVKVLTNETDCATVVKAMKIVPSVTQVLESKPGFGARVCRGREES